MRMLHISIVRIINTNFYRDHALCPFVLYLVHSKFSEVDTVIIHTLKIRETETRTTRIVFSGGALLEALTNSRGLMWASTTRMKIPWWGLLA